VHKGVPTSPCILVWAPWPQLGGCSTTWTLVLIRSSLQAFWEKRRCVSVLLPGGNFSKKVLASQTEAASTRSYGAGQRTGSKYQSHMGRYNCPVQVVQKHGHGSLLAIVAKWEDMGCTPGTTPEYSSLLRTHEIQKPSVSQGLYPILLLALSALTASTYTSLGVSQIRTPDVSYVKRQSTTQPHQLLNACGLEKQRAFL
jgi:hypothetical protein